MFDFFSWEGDKLIYTKKLEIEPNDAEKFTIIHELSVEYHYTYVGPNKVKKKFAM